MDGAGDVSLKELTRGVDPNIEEEYASLSKVLLEFTNIDSIDKAWIFKSGMVLQKGIHCVFIFSIS